jgi:hypothetical protein
MVYYHISLFQRYGIFCIWMIAQASCPVLKYELKGRFKLKPNFSFYSDTKKSNHLTWDRHAIKKLVSGNWSAARIHHVASMLASCVSMTTMKATHGGPECVKMEEILDSVSWCVMFSLYLRNLFMLKSFSRDWNKQEIVIVKNIVTLVMLLIFFYPLV